MTLNTCHSLILTLFLMVSNKLTELLLTSFLRIFKVGSRVIYLPMASAELSPVAFHCLVTKWVALLMSWNVKYYSSVWHSEQTFWNQYQSETRPWVRHLIWSKFKNMSISFSLSCNRVMDWCASLSLSHCVSPLHHWINTLISIAAVADILCVSRNVLTSNGPSACQEQLMILQVTPTQLEETVLYLFKWN